MAPFTDEQKKDECLLSDEALSHVFSFLPAPESARLRQLSQRYSRITQQYYQLLSLPLLSVVNVEFKKATGATVSIIVERMPIPGNFKGCIRCTSTSMTVYSHFQPAFYYFQRTLGILPKFWPLAGSIGNGLAVRIPVNSLEESIALLLDYLKRNVAMGQLIITEESTIGKSHITGNMYKIFQSFAKSVSTCRVCPILHIDFSPEYSHIHRDMLQNYSGWLCNLREFSQNDVEAVKKMKPSSWWLHLVRQPPAIFLFQILGVLLTEWLNCNTQIACISFRIISKHDFEEGVRYLENLNYYDDFNVRFFFDGMILDSTPYLSILGHENGAFLCTCNNYGRIIICKGELRRYFRI